MFVLTAYGSLIASAQKAQLQNDVKHREYNLHIKMNQ